MRKNTTHLSKMMFATQPSKQDEQTEAAVKAEGEEETKSSEVAVDEKPAEA